MNVLSVSFFLPFVAWQYVMMSLLEVVTGSKEKAEYWLNIINWFILAMGLIVLVFTSYQLALDIYYEPKSSLLILGMIAIPVGLWVLLEKLFGPFFTLEDLEKIAETKQKIEQLQEELDALEECDD